MRLASALLFLALPARAADRVVAVLSSDNPHYVRAFQAFQSAFGEPVKSFNMKDGPPRIGQRTRVVVAFGVRATVHPYPSEVALVHALSLGAPPPERRGPTARIFLAPAPNLLVAELQRIQPELRRLAVLWSTEVLAEYTTHLSAAGAGLGIRVQVRRVRGADELPAALRRLEGQADAVWLSADPFLLDARSFQTLRDFCSENKVALYVSAPGLAERGAVAELITGAEATGRLAAEAARAALEERRLPPAMYAPSVDVTLNLPAARRVGIEPPDEELRRVKVLR